MNVVKIDSKFRFSLVHRYGGFGQKLELNTPWLPTGQTAY